MRTEVVGYDPLKYWYESGMNYHVSINTDKEIEFLKQCIQDHHLSNSDILEIGSGHGRIFMSIKDFLADHRKFIMCDIVNTMRFRCFRTTGMLPDEWVGKVLPYAANKFDMVISFSVMLHVPPQDIDKHFTECWRVTKKFLYIATCTANDGPLASHCFIHDYHKLIRDNNMDTVDFKSYPYDHGRSLRTNWLLRKR